MTTKESKRLFELVNKMSAAEKMTDLSVKKSKSDPQASEDKKRGRLRSDNALIEPPHGEKGEFIKMTITLSPDAYDILNNEVARRKRARMKGSTISAIIRELAGKYLAHDD